MQQKKKKQKIPTLGCAINVVSECEMNRFENKTQKTCHLLPQIKTKNTTDDITFLHIKLSHAVSFSVDQRHYQFQQLLLISVTYSYVFL